MGQISKRLPISKRWILGALVVPWVGLSTLGAGAAVRGFDGSTWLQDAEGMFAAIRSIERERAPMVVYFYTDWCGYCRQFERELLGTTEVKDYFSDVLTVRINPENGSKEQEIAQYYGVQAYPGFFVHSGSSQSLSRVERMKFENGRPQIMSPAEFIAACRAAAAR